jgi:hypothetical protein
MSWLFDEEFVARMFTVLAFATPVAAVIGGIVHRRFAGGQRRRVWVLWAAFGLLGPLNFGLWPLYNSIEDRWGLDSVRALLVNFGVFIALGLALGLLLRLLLRPAESVSAPPPPAGPYGVSHESLAAFESRPPEH